MHVANMTVNSSSTFSNASSSIYANTEVFCHLIIAFSALRILLLLPLSTFVLYLGHQRWRQHRSSKPATHSDIFTYHMAVMELIWVLGSLLYFVSIYTNHLVMMKTGLNLSSITFYGHTLFHVLTCVERYLAVVHPITYMGLRNARGVRIRNICVGCVWLLCFGLISFTAVTLPDSTMVLSFCFLGFAILILSFCSLSVLCVLIRPGPGDEGRGKERVDQSKQRAFYIITVISVTVWLWFVGLLVSFALHMSLQLSSSVACVVSFIFSWLNLPSSLVSPLLYLHRAGKLSCCHRNNK